MAACVHVYLEVIAWIQLTTQYISVSKFALLLQVLSLYPGNNYVIQREIIIVRKNLTKDWEDNAKSKVSTTTLQALCGLVYDYSIST